MSLDAKSKKILAILERTYPDARTALEFKSAWQLLVAVILSAQCTDARVNIVTRELFKHLKTPKDFADAPLPKIEKLIFSTGFYKNKAKSLKGAGRVVHEEFGGKVPSEMDALLTIPGVARKTANVVQQEYFGKVEGVVVDTHIGRVSLRLGFTKSESPKKMEQDLMALLPKSKWRSYGDAAIWHGRKICHARKPNCKECPLNKLCPSAFKV